MSYLHEQNVLEFSNYFDFQLGNFT